MTTMTEHFVSPATPAVHGRPEPLLKIRVPSGWAALDLKSVWRFRDLCLALASRDVKLRYKQTAMGVVWVVLQPLMAAGVLSFVFGKVAKIPSEGPPYFLQVYAAMLAWNLFNSTVTKSSISLVGNSQLISKIFFPRLVLPLSTIPSALLDFTIAVLMMSVLMVLYHQHPTAALLLLPFWTAAVLMLATGIGLWAAALTVPYRDVQYILPVFMQLLLYGSPVAYTLHRVPANLRKIYSLNPLSPILEGFRSCILGTTPPALWSVFYAAAVSVGLFLVGAFVFKRMERKFADVI
jgi:lipopolysaccharide transport system permease protein